MPVAAVLANGQNSNTGSVSIVHDDKVEKRDVALGLKTARSVTILSGFPPATGW